MSVGREHVGVSITVSSSAPGELEFPGSSLDAMLNFHGHGLLFDFVFKFIRPLFSSLLTRNSRTGKGRSANARSMLRDDTI